MDGNGVWNGDMCGIRKEAPRRAVEIHLRKYTSKYRGNVGKRWRINHGSEGHENKSWINIAKGISRFLGKLDKIRNTNRKWTTFFDWFPLVRSYHIGVNYQFTVFKRSTVRNFQFNIMKIIIANYSRLNSSDLYRPRNPAPRPPKVFKKGDLAPPPTLEKLNFYFGQFSINSGEIVIFQ